MLLVVVVNRPRGNRRRISCAHTVARVGRLGQAVSALFEAGQLELAVCLGIGRVLDAGHRGIKGVVLPRFDFVGQARGLCGIDALGPVLKRERGAVHARARFGVDLDELSRRVELGVLKLLVAKGALLFLTRAIGALDLEDLGGLGSDHVRRDARLLKVVVTVRQAVHGVHEVLAEDRRTRGRVNVIGHFARVDLGCPAVVSAGGVLARDRRDSCGNAHRVGAVGIVALIEIERHALEVVLGAAVLKVLGELHVAAEHLVGHGRRRHVAGESLARSRHRAICLDDQLDVARAHMARRHLRLVDAVGTRRDTHQAARGVARHADVRAQIALGVITLGHARLAHVGRDVAARVARPDAVGFAVRADLERYVVQRLARRAGRGITDLVQRELGGRVGDGPGVNVARDPIDRSVIPIRGDKAVGARSGLEHAIPVGHARLVGFGQVAEGERPMGVVGLAPHDLRGRAIRLASGDPVHTVRRTLQAQAHRRLRIGKGGRKSRFIIVPCLGAAHLDGIERVGEESTGRRTRARSGGYGHQAYRAPRNRLRSICDLHTRRTVGTHHALHHAIGIRMSRGIARRQVRKRCACAFANALQYHRTEFCVKGAVLIERRDVRHVAAAVRGDPAPAGTAVGAALQGVTHRPGIARSRGPGARVPGVLLIVPRLGEREAHRRERVRHGRGIDGLGAIRAALGVQSRIVRVVARIAIAAVRIGIGKLNHGGCCAVFVVDQVLLDHAVLHLIGRIAAQDRAR